MKFATRYWIVLGMGAAVGISAALATTTFAQEQEDSTLVELFVGGVTRVTPKQQVVTVSCKASSTENATDIGHSCRCVRVGQQAYQVRRTTYFSNGAKVNKLETASTMAKDYCELQVSQSAWCSNED